LHLLLDTRISIENVQYGNIDLDKEKEADDFAIENTFTLEQEAFALQCFPILSEDIAALAKKFNTHPALIVGRFQKRGLMAYSVGREFIKSINLE